MTTKYLIGNNSSFSDATRWSLSSGGPNNTGMPVDGDTVVLTSGATGAAIMNLLVSFNLTTVVGWVGTLTLANAMNCSGRDVLHAATATIIGGGFAITVRDWIQTGSAKMTKTSALGLFKVQRHFENSSASTGNSWLNGVTIGTAGQQSNIRCDTNGNRTNFMRVAGASYKLTGRLYFDTVYATGFNNVVSDNGSQQHWVKPTFPGLSALECIFILTASSMIRMTPSSFPVIVKDWGRVRFDASNTDSTIGVGAIYTNVGEIEAWKSNSIATLTVNGSLQCTHLKIGNASATNRGGRVKGTGSIVCSQLTAYNNTHNGTIEADLDVRTLTAFSCSGAFTLQANATLTGTGSALTLGTITNVAIAAAAICSFGLTTLKFTGTYSNPTNANNPYKVIVDTSLNTAQLLSLLRPTGVLSFIGSGTFDSNNQSIRIDSFGAQMGGAELITWVNAALGGTLTLNITGGDWVSIPGQVYLGLNLAFVRSGTEAEFFILGNTEFDIVTAGNLIKVRLGGYTLTCSNRFENAGSSSASTLALEGGTLNALNYEHEGALATLVGPGAINCSNELRNIDGTMDCTGVAISANNWTAAAIAVVSLGTGSITTLTYAWTAGFVLNINTGALSVAQSFAVPGGVTVNAGAGALTNTGNGAGETVVLGGLVFDYVIASKSGGDIFYTDVIAANQEFVTNVAIGQAYTVKIQSGLAHSAGKFRTQGSGAGLVTIRSENAGVTRWDFTVTGATLIDRNANIGDSNLIGVEQLVDTNTGADGGNNDTTPGNQFAFGSYSPYTLNPNLRSRMQLGLGLGI